MILTLKTLSQLKFPASITRSLIMLMIILGVAACTQQAAKKKAIEQQLTIAHAAQSSGDYSLAAQVFLTLAHLTPATLEDGSVSPARQDYLLTATENHIKAKESVDARKALVLLDREELGNADQFRFDLTTAQVAELDDRPEKVIEAFTQTQLATLSPDHAKRVWQYRIDAYTALDDPFNAARARAEIDALLPPTAQTENRKLIWQSIETFTLDELDVNTQNANGGTNMTPTFAGWIALANVARSSLYDADKFLNAISQWRLDYPAHAAESPVLETLIETSNKLGKKINTIALLLPQEGRFAQAGAAIRDGFLSAWYGENQNPSQPMVNVYAADVSNISQVYQRAVEEGADLVVGPLEKDAIQTLIQAPTLPVPTLALNQLDQGNDLSQAATHIRENTLYQFGLPPEDEARQAAIYAFHRGMSYAVAITPEGVWGDRLYEAFHDEFVSLGGEVLTHQMIPNQDVDYSSLIKNLLNIEQSETRYKALEYTLKRQIKFEPRARKDMDFIFLASLPEQARQIRPQLLFHRSSKTPVLATSHVYGLPVRDEPDLDMEGVLFADMPWMLKQPSRDRETPLSMQNNWPDTNAVFLRLFALGQDAYKIAPHLGRLRYVEDSTLEGETGVLRVNPQGIIHRELTWAQFKSGIPKAISPAMSDLDHAEMDDE